MRRFWNWGVGLATAYTIFAGATLGFVTFAMSEKVDLVSPDYYASALNHDARQAASARALALGNAFQIEVAADGRTLAIGWPEAAQPASGRVRLYRPSNSSADRTERVQPHAARQLILLADVAPGSWVVQCEWIAGGLSYYAEKHVVIR